MPLPSDHQVGWRDEAFWNQKKEREARWRKEVWVITSWKFSSVSSNFFSFQPDLQRATESDESWSPILFEGRRRRGRWNVGHGQSLRISKQTAGKIISIEPYWTNWVSKNQKIELRTGPLWPVNPQEAQQQKQRRLFVAVVCLTPMILLVTTYVALCCLVPLPGPSAWGTQQLWNFNWFMFFQVENFVKLHEATKSFCCLSVFTTRSQWTHYRTSLYTFRTFQPPQRDLAEMSWKTSAFDLNFMFENDSVTPRLALWNAVWHSTSGAQREEG